MSGWGSKGELGQVMLSKGEKLRKHVKSVPKNLKEQEYYLVDIFSFNQLVRVFPIFQHQKMIKIIYRKLTVSHVASGFSGDER